MRPLLLTGLACLTLAAGAADAQARARLRPAHAGHAPAGPAVHPAAPAPDVALREAPGARPTYVLLPGAGDGPDRALPTAAPPSPVPAPPPGPAQAAAPVPAPPPAAAKAVAEAAPWCRSGRVVGTGAGFCLIN